jgi:hypothetical protein
MNWMNYYVKDGCSILNCSMHCFTTVSVYAGHTCLCYSAACLSSSVSLPCHYCFMASRSRSLSWALSYSSAFSSLQNDVGRSLTVIPGRGTCRSTYPSSWSLFVTVWPIECAHKIWPLCDGTFCISALLNLFQLCTPWSHWEFIYFFSMAT